MKAPPSTATRSCHCSMPSPPGSSAVESSHAPHEMQQNVLFRHVSRPLRRRCAEHQLWYLQGPLLWKRIWIRHPDPEAKSCSLFIPTLDVVHPFNVGGALKQGLHSLHLPSMAWHPLDADLRAVLPGPQKEPDCGVPHLKRPPVTQDDVALDCISQAHGKSTFCELLHRCTPLLHLVPSPDHLH